MLKLVMVGGLMLVVIGIAATRPHGRTPQQIYFRLHHDDEAFPPPW